MFLKNLSIYNENTLIRNIPFHKGVNLIVDETSSTSKTDSGNSVGKTTVLRLIDFCLDGKGQNIYMDPEFKGPNSAVEEFLTGNNIVITLTLVDNIDDEFSKKVVIRRNFLSYTKKIQSINNEPKKNDEFSTELKRLIFKSKTKNPTFKQLKSKNIRDEKNKLVNTIRVLAPNVVTDAVYEALHLFWFGLDVNLSKDKLVRDRNSEIKLQARLRKRNNLSQIKQSLIIVNKEIKKLTTKRDLLNLNEDYEKDFKYLNTVKFQINRLSEELSHLQLRRELIIESKLDLENDIANIDTRRISAMYRKAQQLIPDLQKTFEETLVFHNEMISQKINFITEELPALNSKILKLELEIKTKLKEEAKLSKDLKKSGAMEDLQKIITELNVFYEKKGVFEEQKNLWENTEKELKDINEKLDKINKDIYSKDETIQKRIEEFNVHFSDISSRLDGVHSLLSADCVDDVYKFSIGNIEGNPGTGSKKSQMASFDLAYIKFADEQGIPCLHFVLQDQIENVHSNQITNLFTEIVDEVNCQYVLPVLRDKLPRDINIENLEILSLSQSKKLFKF